MHRQDSLFPIDPLALIAACRRLEAKITLYAPELTAPQCERLLGELAITDGLLSRLTEKIRRAPEWQRRMALPEAPTGLTEPGLLPERRARSWRSPRPIVLYPRKAVAKRGPDERAPAEDPAPLPGNGSPVRLSRGPRGGKGR